MFRIFESPTKNYLPNEDRAKDHAYHDSCKHQFYDKKRTYAFFQVLSFRDPFHVCVVEAQIGYECEKAHIGQSKSHYPIGFGTHVP